MIFLNILTNLNFRINFIASRILMVCTHTLKVLDQHQSLVA